MCAYNKILVFGDSHVAGCELATTHSLEDYLQGKITLEEADAEGKKFSFAQILADKLNIPCENYALTGGSNDRSLRKLTETITNNCLVIFGYTSPDRKEFYYPDNGLFLGRDSDNFIQTGIQWTGMIQEATKQSNMTHPFNDVFVEQILRPYDNIKQVYTCVKGVCEAHTASVLHVNMSEGAYDYLEDLEGCSNYLDWCKQNNFEQKPYLHYGQDAHKALADLLYGKILGLSFNT